MKLAFVYTAGRLRRREKLSSGEAPSDFFYGSEELRAKGHDVELFELPSDVPRSFLARLFDSVIPLHSRPMRLNGELLDQSRAMLRRLSGFDAVVVAGSGPAFAFAFWKMMGRLAPALIAIHCGLMNNQYNPVKRALSRKLLKNSFTLLFGDAELQPMIDLFGIEGSRLAVNQCGIDSDFWCPGDALERGDYIFTIGNDGRRDYPLVIKTSGMMTEPFKLVTSARIDEPIPENVTIIAGDLRKEILTDEEVRDLYRRAKCVIVPLRESLQPSGQSVCLQAMACECPVVLTDTSGLWSRALMQDGVNVRLVKEGDSESMKQGIASILSDASKAAAMGRDGRKTILNDLTMQHYAERLEAFIKQSISHAGR